MTEAANITNPYVGPRTFERAQSHLFFGREREARDLLARVISQRLTLFYAQSGVGKSSLVNTRLIPQLEAEAGFAVLPVGRISGALPAGVATVDNIFLFNLMLRLNQDEGDPSRFAHLSLSDFLAHLVSDDGQTFRYVAEATAPPPSQNSELAPYVLIIDQFEEIITTHLDRWGERIPFFEQLNQAMLDDPNLWVVLVLREDYVASLDPFAGLMAERMRARFYMQRMETAAALQAVQQPAKLGGRPFAPGVAEALVDNLRRIKVLEQAGDQLGQYVEPVQLQVVCYQLWENLYGERSEGQGFDVSSAERAGGKEQGAEDRETEDSGTEDSGTEDRETEDRETEDRETEDRETEDRGQSAVSSLQSPITYNYITLDDLKTLAGDKDLADFVNQALGDYYKQAIAKVLQLPEINVNERELRDWFTEKLITQEETRGLVHQGEVDTGGLPNAAVHLMEQQFLIHAESRAGGLWYELVHDRFVQPILQANRDWLLARNNPLTVAARLWRENQQDPARLLRGAQLTDAQRYAEEHPRELGEAERKFLAASVRQSGIEVEAERQRELAQACALAEEQARAATWFRRFTMGLAILALLALIAIVAMIYQNRIVTQLKNQLRAEQLAQTARVIGSESNLPQRGLLLAIEASQVVIPPLPSAIQALHTLLGHIGGQVLRMHDVEVTSVVFSPDGKLLATGNDDNSIRLWKVDTPTTEPVVLRGHTARVNTVAFSPDGKLLASGSDDNSIRLWKVDTPTAEPVVLHGHTSAVNTVAFSPDGKLLATGSWDNSIRLWKVDTPTAEPVVLREHTSAVTSVVFSPDGKLLATGSWDNSIRLWKVDTPTAEPVVLRGHTARVNTVAFSPDGKLLASGSNDNSIRLWKVDTPTAEPVVLRGYDDSVLAVAFSPDGKLLATGSADYSIHLWKIHDPISEFMVLHGHTSAVNTVAFSPDGKLLASGSDDNSIRLWKVDTPTAEPVVLHGHTSAVTSVVFSPDGKLLATGSWDNSIRLWKVDTPTTEFVVLHGHTSAVTSVVFSPDGKLLATGSDDNSIRLWKVDTPTTEPVVLRGHTARVNTVAFSPDGKLLATGSADYSIHLWKIHDPISEFMVLHGHTSAVNTVAFSPDGKLLASGSDDNSIRLWKVDTPTAEPVVLHGHNAKIASVVFSPDGKLLATGSWDNSIRLWKVDTPTAEPVVLRGHTSAVTSVVFSPDGKLLATGSDDNSIRLWKVDTPTTEPVVLRGYDDSVLAVAFSPDGKLLAGGSWDTTVRLWQVQLEDLVALACHTAGRNLTQEEWQQYFPGEEYRKTCSDSQLQLFPLLPLAIPAPVPITTPTTTPIARSPQLLSPLATP